MMMSRKLLLTGQRNQIAIIDDEPDIAKLFSEGLEWPDLKQSRLMTQKMQ